MRTSLLLAACLALATPAFADIDSDGPRDRATGQLHGERYGSGPRNSATGGITVGTIKARHNKAMAGLIKMRAAGQITRSEYRSSRAALVAAKRSQIAAAKANQRRNGTSGGYDLGKGRDNYDPGPQPNGPNRRATNPD